MDRCDAYGHLAANCVELARTMDSPRNRSIMLQMALVWLRLAEYAAKSAARKECTEFISPASLEASELCTLGEGQKSECSSSDSSSSRWRSEVGAGVLPGIWRNVVAYGGL